MRDEGPSPEDLARFGDDSGYCSSCGAEVYDDAGYCPECGEPLPGGAFSRPPVDEWFRRRWIIFVAIILILALLLWVF